IVAWVLFPVVLLAVCLGCGLAVERVGGWRLPGALLPSVGLALIIVTATLLTYQASTAPFTTAAVVALALAGYAGSKRRLGELRPLVAQDIAWIFQPYLAVILSLGGVALYQLLDGIVRSRALLALCAFVAAQSGLVYALYLETSIKELATTWIVTVTVALVLATLRGALG